MRKHKTDETEGATPLFLIFCTFLKVHHLRLFLVLGTFLKVQNRLWWCRVPLKKIERDFAPIIIIPWLLFVAPLALLP